MEKFLESRTGGEMVRCKECVFSEPASDPTNIGKRIFVCLYNPPVPMIVMNKGLLSGGQGTGNLISINPPVDPEKRCAHGKRVKTVTN